MEIEPTIRFSGTGFQGHSLNATRPIPCLTSSSETSVVSLTQWCERNFISKDIGRTLLKKKLLIGFRRHHEWWVRANPDCLTELLDYLGVEELAFDIGIG